MSAPVSDLNWRRRGACKDADPEIFFRESARGIEKAKKVCRVCPVQGACLTWVLDQDDDRFGIAAGMTPHERYLLRVATGRAA